MVLNGKLTLCRLEVNDIERLFKHVDSKSTKLIYDIEGHLKRANSKSTKLLIEMLMSFIGVEETFKRI